MAEADWANRPWNERDDKQLREILAIGEAYAFAARVLGRTQSAVQKRVHELGMTKPKSAKLVIEERRAKVRELHAQGLTTAEIIRAMPGHKAGFAHADQKAMKLVPNHKPRKAGSRPLDFRRVKGKKGNWE